MQNLNFYFHLAASSSSSQLKHEQNKGNGAPRSNPPRISRTISRDDRTGNYI